MKKKVLMLFLIFISLTAFSADKTSKESLPVIKINYRLNLQDPDRSNFVKWTVGSDSAKDTLDVITGASQSKTTRNLLSLSRNGKTKVGPESLRTLLLFPVSPFRMIKDDNLVVTSQGKQLEISFIHRGYALKITTDEKGYINVPTDCWIKDGLADNKNGTFTYREEFLQEGKDGSTSENVDWNKITLLADGPDEKATLQYTGKIKAGFKNGILTLKGTLKGKEIIREEIKEDQGKPEDGPGAEESAGPGDKTAPKNAPSQS